VNLATLRGFGLSWRYDHQRLEMEGDQLGVLGSSYGDQDMDEPFNDDIRLLSHCRLERHHIQWHGCLLPVRLIPPLRSGLQCCGDISQAEHQGVGVDG
jgi:hypothetical protein